MYRGADKSLARQGRKQVTATDFSIYPIYNHNWTNISTIYMLLFVFLALQPIVVVFSQPGSGL